MNVNDEAGRLDTLTDYGLLDTPSDPRLDAIVAEAAERFGTSMAMVTLIDRHRQWFKARVGTTTSETPIEESFCAHAIRSPDPLVVFDARSDGRFADMACVRAEPGIRFYAGAPLTLRNGTRVGTLCIADEAVRDGFSDDDRALLVQLARRTVAEFELERDLDREGYVAPEDEAAWLAQAANLLGRASLVLERCGASAPLAQLEDVIAQVDRLAGSEPI